MVVWTWANAIFWSGVPLIGWSRITYEPSRLSCTLDLLDPDWKYVLYILLTLVIFYVAPVLFICYLRITHAANRSDVRAQELRQRLSVSVENRCFEFWSLF